MHGGALAVHLTLTWQVFAGGGRVVATRMQAVKRAEPGANGGNGARAVNVASDIWTEDGLPVKPAYTLIKLHAHDKPSLLTEASQALRCVLDLNTWFEGVVLGKAQIMIGVCVGMRCTVSCALLGCEQLRRL